MYGPVQVQYSGDIIDNNNQLFNLFIEAPTFPPSSQNNPKWTGARTMQFLLPSSFQIRIFTGLPVPLPTAI